MPSSVAVAFSSAAAAFFLLIIGESDGMARKYTKRDTGDESQSSPISSTVGQPSPQPASPKAATVTTYHVTCPAMGGKPFVTECGCPADADKAFSEACAGLDEDAALSVTEA